MWRYHPFTVGSDYDTDIFDSTNRELNFIALGGTNRGVFCGRT